MGTDPRPVTEFEDDEGSKLHATWSRSGKRLIVTVERRRQWAQVELRPEEAAELARWLTASAG
ncbi:hypothetical protein [Conexibacter sp. SYSU D00693]|uniref:hypothetical protein n=1 Tax=Conexibacter sp. SYSU D00693 TaxID=2812560 RepID=UPI00196AB139|nr:hypothetical protein [Conexibacter sp. SYSU D00693]